MKIDNWLTFEDTNKGLDVVKQEDLNYYTDIYEPWQTKGKLRIGREVEWNVWWWEKKYCFVTLASSQSLTDNSTTKILFDTFDTNDNDMEWTNRIKITKTGYYFVSAKLTYASNSIWVRRMSIEKQSWNEIIANFFTNAVNWTLTQTIIDSIFYLEQWKELEVYGRQTSWWNLNVNSWLVDSYLKLIEL